MIIYPAIDLIDGKAVRLLKGDYAQKTVYNDDPAAVANGFKDAGATHIHLVDLDGSKSGNTPNLKTILKIKEGSGLFCEAGGGIRSLEMIEKYLGNGVDRVILGTAAVTEKGLVEKAVGIYGEHIAVGIDVRDGFVAIKGWTEATELTTKEFFRHMQDAGVSTVICTDISKDGAMQGTNLDLYKELSEEFAVRLIASGGVSDIESVLALKQLGIHGAIIGKALYTGAIDLSEAIEAGK